MPDIYGSSFLKDAETELYNLLDALKTELATYTYKYDYLHTRHNVANLQLNAVTFELQNINSLPEDGAVGVSAGNVTNFYLCSFNVRIHTAYEGSRFEPAEAMYIANSIVNKMMANQDASEFNVVAVEEITNSALFDGGTRGSEFTFTLEIAVTHAQE